MNTLSASLTIGFACIGLLACARPPPAAAPAQPVETTSAVLPVAAAPATPRPADEPNDYARARWFEEYMDGGLIPLAGPKVFFALVLKPMRGKTAVDPADEVVAQKVVAEDLPVFWDYLERELGDRAYFVGETLTLADIAVASPHVNLRHAGVAPERKRWPRLRAFLDRMYARPSFKKVIEEEAPIFGKRSAKITD